MYRKWCGYVTCLLVHRSSDPRAPHLARWGGLHNVTEILALELVAVIGWSLGYLTSDEVYAFCVRDMIWNGGTDSEQISRLWQRQCHTVKTRFPFPPGHPEKLYFLAIFVIWWSCMAEFWPMECMWAVRSGATKRSERWGSATIWATWRNKLISRIRKGPLMPQV